jgi:hypothetical protein
MSARVNPFADLNAPLPAFALKSKKDQTLAEEAISRIAEENNFPSRQAPRVPREPRRKRRVYTTGRNRQFNIKATTETVDRFYRMADERRVTLCALLEQAWMLWREQRCQSIRVGYGLHMPGKRLRSRLVTLSVTSGSLAKASSSAASVGLSATKVLLMAFSVVMGFQTLPGIRARACRLPVKPGSKRAAQVENRRLSGRKCLPRSEAAGRRSSLRGGRRCLSSSEAGGR